MIFVCDLDRLPGRGLDEPLSGSSGGLAPGRPLRDFVRQDTLPQFVREGVAPHGRYIIIVPRIDKLADEVVIVAVCLGAQVQEEG